MEWEIENVHQGSLDAPGSSQTSSGGSSIRCPAGYTAVDISYDPGANQTRLLSTVLASHG